MAREDSFAVMKLSTPEVEARNRTVEQWFRVRIGAIECSHSSEHMHVGTQVHVEEADITVFLSGHELINSTGRGLFQDRHGVPADYFPLQARGYDFHPASSLFPLRSVTTLLLDCTQYTPDLRHVSQSGMLERNETQRKTLFLKQVTVRAAREQREEF